MKALNQLHPAVQYVGSFAVGAIGYLATLPQPIVWTPSVVGLVISAGLGATGLFHLVPPRANPTAGT